MQFADVACALKTQTAMKAALQCARFLRTFQNLPSICTTKTKTHANSYRINVRLQYRSGETRTRGLLLPKQARYQLRNTPASGGTAAPPEYSISFFARFVNTESAADGAARSAFFQSAEAAAGNSEKGRGSRRFLKSWAWLWRNCQKENTKTIQSAKLVALQLQAGWKGAIIALYRREMRRWESKRQLKEKGTA